ncbi:hypothetical protein QFW96_29930 [Saccharopolyspora sp. TS4A08]|uniref:DUF6542 domain-containing protein n=1 Tax=Saccharopolyspora ipomoeae TaxID=3042027 RepID=A0ABT6PXY5_9PSEU|nr:DUF6542 domain-containing protein [Saccharopolyspora sp. TS4A08]MDI2032874.1 hypothetical protein [Saccharopolyspora sp. TS4A08]
MTAIRESQSASTTGNGAPEWGARSAFSTLGVPLWGAVLLAAVPTAVGTLLDTLIWQQPGYIFKTAFFLGSLAAVLLVQRRSVFGPMVQPPLVLGIVMPVLVLIAGAGSTSGAGIAGKALSVARPLITSFPIMAGATAVALGIGLLRMFVTQKAEPEDDFDLGVDPDAKTKKARPVPPPRKKAARDDEPRKRPADRAPREDRRSTDGRKSSESRKSRGDGRRPREEGRGGERRADGRQQPRGTGPRDAQGRPNGDAPRRDVPPAGRPPRPANDPRAGGPRPPRQGAPGRPRPPEPPPGRRPRRPGP